MKPKTQLTTRKRFYKLREASWGEKSGSLKIAGQMIPKRHEHHAAAVFKRNSFIVLAILDIHRLEYPQDALGLHEKPYIASAAVRREQVRNDHARLLTNQNQVNKKQKRFKYGSFTEQT